MKRAAVAIALAFLVLGGDRIGASADSNPADPQQQLSVIDQIRAQLGSNLADAMAAQDQLKKSLLDNAVQQQAVQAKIDAVQARIAELGSEMAQLRSLEAQEQTSMSQLQEKIDETRGELARLSSQSAALAQQVTDMLQQQQDAIIAAAMQAVWTQMQIWLQSNNVGQIPTSTGHSTQYRFIWPQPQAQISQPLGPSTFWFEPPYGGYPHFHTGIHLLAPSGAPRLRAGSR